MRSYGLTRYRGPKWPPIWAGSLSSSRRWRPQWIGSLPRIKSGRRLLCYKLMSILYNEKLKEQSGRNIINTTATTTTTSSCVVGSSKCGGGSSSSSRSSRSRRRRGLESPLLWTCLQTTGQTTQRETKNKRGAPCAGCVFW